MKGEKHCSSRKSIGIRAVLLAGVLLLSIFLGTACANNGGNESESGTGAQTSTAPSAETTVAPEPSERPVSSESDPATGGGENDPADLGFSKWQPFSHNGVAISPGMEMDPLLEKLGNPLSSFEAPSCLFEGNDYVYDYGGFELNAAKIDGKITCVGLFLIGDSTKTPEGIGIGSSVDDVLSAYGDYDEEGFGRYIWTDNHVDLIIMTVDDEVTSISYLMKYDD